MSKISPELRKKIKRLHERGVPIPKIAEAMGRSEERIRALLKKCDEMSHAQIRGGISRLVTVKDPDAYMRQRKVNYRLC